jgi:hypothetical protein
VMVERHDSTVRIFDPMSGFQYRFPVVFSHKGRLEIELRDFFA